MYDDNLKKNRMDLHLTATNDRQRVHPTPQPSHQGATLRVSLVSWRGIDLESLTCSSQRIGLL